MLSNLETASQKKIHPLHYGQFWVILSQNWGMNFCSFGFIFILFLRILASKAHNTVDHVPNLKMFEFETKLHLQGLNFKLEFWDKNLQNRPQCTIETLISIGLRFLAESFSILNLSFNATHSYLGPYLYTQLYSRNHNSTYSCHCNK